MIKSFAAACKRGINRVVAKIQEYQKNRKRVYRVGDGGTVTVCNAKWLGKKAKRFDKTFARPEVEKIKTNIAKEPVFSLKSQTRDYWLERTLKTGGYTFFDMFLVKNPYGEAPLSALALFVTETACGVRVTVKGDIPETDFSAELPEAKYHRVPILGLYPGRENQIHFELLDKEGKVFAERTVPLRVKGLPKNLKKVITVKKVSKNPGLSNILITGGSDIRPCVIDREGKIRWYTRRKPKGYGLFLLSNGRFLFLESNISAPSFTNPHSVQMYDMDFLGRVRRTYLVKNGIHHSACEMEMGGNIIGAGSSMEGQLEDLIMEIDRRTGQIVHQVKLGDIFDKTYQDRVDWAHLNSVSYNETENTVLVSMRNIHSVSSVDWKTGEMRWLLSDVRFWKGTEMEDKLLRPEGEVPFFYQQHAAYEIDADLDGNPETKHILVFDNHWHKRRRVEFFDNDKKSYVTIYTINEAKKTVSLYKRFPCPKSKIRSNALFLQKRNRLYAMAGSLVKPLDGNIGVIREYDVKKEKVLSEIYVKPGFFSAREFEPCVPELAKPLLAGKEYLCGDLKRPERLSKEEFLSLHFHKMKRVSDMAVDYRMHEDILYIHGVDHSIRKVYFIGKKDNFVVDFSETHQTMEVFETAEYYIAMWLDTLPSDSYQMYLDLRGEIQYTGAYISK